MTVEERIRKQRDQKLIALGYCTQVFNPDDVVEEGNNGFTYDESAEGHVYPEVDTATGQHFRYVADDVTDEQFRQILAIGDPPTIKTSNTLATTLTVLGWIFCIVLVFIGFTSASSTGYYKSTFNGAIFAIWSAAGVGTLLTLLWLAEVLKLLQRIHDKL